MTNPLNDPLTPAEIDEMKAGLVGRSDGHRGTQHFVDDPAWTTERARRLLNMIAPPLPEPTPPIEPGVKTYTVNEVFYSLQGEGVRAGTANVFVRFTGCNLRCDVEPGPKSPGGFACDTEFMSGRKLTLEQLDEEINRVSALAGTGLRCPWLILTGGEPALQVDAEFCDFFHSRQYDLAIETNGSVELPWANEEYARGDEGEAHYRKRYLLDWITVSPKVAEHAIKQRYAHEVKYVRHYGQAIPNTVVQADHYVISPSFLGDQLDDEALAWCIKLVKENPKWRLSVQQHKGWKVR